jgi:membrane protein implicated in regulation of membrane protease activity
MAKPSVTSIAVIAAAAAWMFLTGVEWAGIAFAVLLAAVIAAYAVLAAASRHNRPGDKRLARQIR